MCMHAGSPLQKNAPIFGNDFTVTFDTCIIYVLILCAVYNIYIKNNRILQYYMNTLSCLVY